MRITFIADARSPIAQNWIRYFIAVGHEVHVISSYPCAPDVLPGASVQVVPVAFASFAKPGGVQENGKKVKSVFTGRLRSATITSLAYTARHWLGPLDIYRQVGTVRRFLREIKPDLVHAMRIPFEGILAALTLKSSRIPLLISVWGNDFTLHAPQSPLMRRMTHKAMQRANALHPDCQRDLHLAREWGFDKAKPAVVLPGNGGIQTDIFQPGTPRLRVAAHWNVTEGASIVVNPRGFRRYVRNDSFFRAIPLVLAERPNVVFLGLSMQGSSIAEQWIERLQIRHAIRLLPPVPRNEMADLFRLAAVTISPSEHDGTPNTILEAMACGSFPVVGDIESLREWIKDGVNGFLCDPANPASLARAIIQALNDKDLRQQAATQNRQLVIDKADYQKTMVAAEQFYRDIIASIRGDC